MTTSLHSGVQLHPDHFPLLTRPRLADSHKGTYGEVGVAGGARGMVGAVLLASRAALILGAGKVHVHALGAPDLLFDPLYPELMFTAPDNWPDHTVMVAGCGLGTSAAAAALLRLLLQRPAPLVLDADALNLLAVSPQLSQLAQARAASGSVLVLTPHPGEAARLLGTDTAAIQSDRVAAATLLARHYQAMVVLKGSGTVIALPASEPSACAHWINPTGNAKLATAGTGDVLSGMIGGLLAQAWRLTPPEKTAPAAAQAVFAAVWWHGQAADSLSRLTASDLAPMAARLRSRACRSRVA